MHRLAGGMSQPLDFVLDHQFSALQFDNLHIVRREVNQSFMQFVFKNFVFAFQFNEMRLNCHTKPPPLDETSDSIRTMECTQVAESVDGY
jgi:hypothetical protein